VPYCEAAVVDSEPDRSRATDGATLDPGERGSLEVRDKVAQRIAVRAALDTPGVQAHAAGLDKLTRRELPRASVDIAATRVHAHLVIAVAWPHSLSQVGVAVQHNVTQALTNSAGFHVDAVDVAIEAIVTPNDDHVRTVL
jgi:uncharacterized alkaline shock family protein YloU